VRCLTCRACRKAAISPATSLLLEYGRSSLEHLLILGGSWHRGWSSLLFRRGWAPRATVDTAKPRLDVARRPADVSHPLEELLTEAGVELNHSVPKPTA
jgi:hypothetical protein